MGEPYLRGHVDRQRAACRSCGAAIRWVATRKGKRMPLDYRPSQGPEANVVVCADGVAEVLGPMDARWASAGDRYTSHFQTCKQADSWRRRK